MHLFQKKLLGKNLRRRIQERLENDKDYLYERLGQELQDVNNLTHAIIQKANTIHLEHQFDELFVHWFFKKIMSARKKFGEYEVDFLKLLKNWGLDYQIKNDKNNTLITVAIAQDHLDCIKLLVEVFDLKVDVNEPVHPIEMAFQKKNKAMADYLIAKLSHYSITSDNVLTMAARYGYQDHFHWFLEQGYADINAPDGQGFTPLMHAIMHERKDIAAALINKNASVAIKNNLGQTVMHLLFEIHNNEWFLELMSSEQFKQIANFVFWKSSAMCDNNGLYPLHYAIQFNKIDWVKKILDTDPTFATVIDAQGRSLLFYAVMANNLSLLQELHQTHKLSLMDRDRSGLSLIDFCHGSQALAIAEWLSEQQAVIFQPELKGICPPVFHAISKKNKEMVRWFLSHPQQTLDMWYFVDEHCPGQNIAHQLVKYRLFDEIKAFDLFKKHNSFLFDKNDAQETCLDWFEPNLDLSKIDDDITFMDYVLKSFSPSRNQQSMPPLSYYSNSTKLIEFCLDAHLLDIEDKIDNDVPIIHVLEANYYHDSLKHSLLIGETSELFVPEEFREYVNNMASYVIYMSVAVEKYRPNLNTKDANGLTLLAKLTQLGPIGHDRINWICEKLQAKITDLDNLNSSLLQLATETGNQELVEWCVARKLSIVSRRDDKKNAMDLALLSENADIASYLFDQLTTKQRKQYFKGLVECEQTTEIEQLKIHQFYGWEPTANERLQLPPTFQKCFTNQAISVTTCAVSEAKNEPKSHASIPVPEEVREDKPTPSQPVSEELFEFDTERLITAILKNEHKWIKQLKKACLDHPAQESKLKDILEHHAFDILCNAVGEKKHSVLYQLIRIKAIQDILPSKLGAIVENIIKRNQQNALSILFRQSFVAEGLSEHGFFFLSVALDYGHIPLFIELMKYTSIKEQAHKHNNHLLHQAASKGFSEVVRRLLSEEDVAKHAASMDNQALKNAAASEDEETCYLLLHTPAVLNALATDDYALVRRAIEMQQHVLIHIMLDIPFIYEWMATQPQYQAIFMSHQGSTFSYDKGDEYLMQEMGMHSPVYAVYTEYNVFDMVCMGDMYALSNYFNTQNKFNPKLIRQLALCALHNGQNLVLHWLIEIDPFRRIKSHTGFCNFLLCQAILMRYDMPMINYLISIEPSGAHLSYFNNRALRLAMRCARPDIAYRLLDFTGVVELANVVNNYVIRHAASLGALALVQKLLSIESVRDNISVFCHDTFRQAYLARQYPVAMHLLMFTSVFDYACQQGELYKGIIIDYVKAHLNYWLEAKIAYDEMSHQGLIDKISLYEPTQQNDVIQALLSRFLEINKKIAASSSDQDMQSDSIDVAIPKHSSPSAHTAGSMFRSKADRKSLNNMNSTQDATDGIDVDQVTESVDRIDVNI